VGKWETVGFRWGRPEATRKRKYGEQRHSLLRKRDDFKKGKDTRKAPDHEGRALPIERDWEFSRALGEKGKNPEVGARRGQESESIRNHSVSSEGEAPMRPSEREVRQ